MMPMLETMLSAIALGFGVVIGAVLGVFVVAGVIHATDKMTEERRRRERMRGWSS